ncbi:uncharacterized protein METZ01_LOCUS402280 [marine metagenome]|uniref:Uncharacterized protein n=1 Tax=marine metagenome TaxID=408172 RepID=A0A382VS65_9ZZZZ
MALLVHNNLDAAGDRLQKALDQLQKTIDGLLNKMDRELSGSVGELDTLRAEREQVGAALAELEQKYEDLRAVAKVVSGRLKDVSTKVSALLSE